MEKVRTAKEFNFEMAHALHGYDGLCANGYGHSCWLWVTDRGGVKKENKLFKDGIVMDFTDLKSIVKPIIIKKEDHSLVFNTKSPHLNLDLSAFDKVYYLPYQPTSENLVSDFANSIISLLPENVELLKVVLSETVSSFAEWNIEDN